jgi:hypothetical protein
VNPCIAIPLDSLFFLMGHYNSSNAANIPIVIVFFSQIFKLDERVAGDVFLHALHRRDHEQASPTSLTLQEFVSLNPRCRVRTGRAPVGIQGGIIKLVLPTRDRTSTDINSFTL